MFLRILFLIALIGIVGSDSRAASSDEDSEEAQMGGEGFGNVVMIFVILGVVALVSVIVIGILAATGQFENTAVDPRV
ncbi:MAG: hypothetical protein ACR2GI_00425 [Thermomicrobiales bacterium]|nr:hypothetical protein [Chloroflexia bacterium]